MIIAQLITDYRDVFIREYQNYVSKSGGRDEAHMGKELNL